MERKSYDMPGGTMSALHYNADKGPVRLIFAHANGFNGQSYRQILEQLPVHSVATDLRGHGMTDLPTDIDALDSFHIFGDDIATFVGRYVPGKVILAGHSFGAVAAILAAPQLKDRLAGYVGFDPVSLPWSARVWAKSRTRRNIMKKRLSIARNAGQRRNRFDSLEAALDRYKGRGAFKYIHEDIIRDYLEGGLLPDGERVRLACDPKWEQAVFCAQAHNLYKAAVDLPEVSEAHYAGKFAVSSKATRAKLGKVIGQESIHFNPEFSHMFPLQEPDYAVRALRALLFKLDFSQRVREVNWEEFTGPEHYDSREIANAIIELSELNTEDEGDILYNRVLFAIGNNHAGTYYPAILKALPFIEELSESRSSQYTKNLAKKILMDLLGSFCAEVGEYSGQSAAEIEAFVHSRRPVGFDLG